jgi:hypothetical protein
MISILLLLFIAFLVLCILIKICNKPQGDWDARDFHNAGLNRVVYGLFFAGIGLATPPLWVVAIVFFLSAWSCFHTAKRITATTNRTSN